MRKKRFEVRGEPLAPPEVYRRRLASHGLVAGGILLVSWIAGACGYHFIAGVPSWLDSFYNAAMILGGMGPVSEIDRSAGKIFASIYALFSGVVLIGSVGIFLTPVFHRLMHRFHLDADES